MMIVSLHYVGKADFESPYLGAAKAQGGAFSYVSKTPESIVERGSAVPRKQLNIYHGDQLRANKPFASRLVAISGKSNL